MTTIALGMELEAIIEVYQEQVGGFIYPQLLDIVIPGFGDSKDSDDTDDA